MNLNQLYKTRSLYDQGQDALKKVARASEEKLNLRKNLISSFYQPSKNKTTARFAIKMATKKLLDVHDTLFSMSKRVIASELKKHIDMEWDLVSAEVYSDDRFGYPAIFLYFDSYDDLPQEWYDKAGIKRP